MSEIVAPERIRLIDYWQGRNVTHAAELTPLIEQNARDTVLLINQFLDIFYRAFPKAARRTVNSGWRPPSINSGVRNASRTSLHMIGKAIDLSDDDEDLDNWCRSPNGLAALERVGLWLEDPGYTPRWCHLQTQPPGSKRRIFIPR